MPDLAELTLRIDSLEASVANKRLNELSVASGRAERSAGGLMSSWGNLAGVLSVVASLASSAAGVFKAFEAAGKFEQTTIAFETLLGSAERAKAMLSELTEVAKRTPFQFEGLTSSVRLMMAMGFAGDEAIPIMLKLGDATSALGGNEEMLKRMVVALGQMRAKGKVSAQEMNQLAEQGVSAWEFLAAAIGVTIPEAMKLAENGAIQAAPAIEGILQGMTRKFSGAMERQSKTLLGRWSNVQDVISLILRDIGQELIDAFDAKGMLTKFTESLVTVGHVLVDVIRIIAGLPPKFTETASVAEDVVRWLNLLKSVAAGIVVIKLIGWVSDLAAGLVALGAAIAANPLMLIPVAIGAAAAAVAYFWNETVTLGDTTATVGDFVVATWDNIRARVTLVVDFIRLLWKHYGDDVKKYAGIAWESYSSYLKAMWGAAKWIVNKLLALWISFFETFGNIVARIGSAIGQIFTTDWTDMSKVKALGESLKVALSPGDIWKETAKSWKENFNRDFLGEFIGLLDAIPEAAAAITGDPAFLELGRQWRALGGMDAGATWDAIARAAAARRAARMAGGGSPQESPQGAPGGPVTAMVKPDFGLVDKMTEAQKRLADAYRDLEERASSVGLLDFERERLSLMGKFTELAKEAIKEEDARTAAIERYGRRLDEVIALEGQESMRARVRDLQREVDIYGVLEPMRERAKYLIEAETDVIHAYGRGTAAAAAALDRLGASYDRMVVARGNDAFRSKVQDLDRQTQLAGMQNVERERANFLLQAQDELMTAYGGDVDRVNAALDVMAEKYDHLLRVQLRSSFVQEFASAVQQGVQDGLWAAIMNDDWQQVLRQLLLNLAQQSFNQGFAALTSTQGGKSNIFLDMVGFVAPAVAGAAGGAAGGTAGGYENAAGSYGGDVGAPPSKMAGTGDIYVFNVPDQATADMLHAKASSKGAQAVVAKGSGVPGMTAGSIRGRRK